VSPQKYWNVVYRYAAIAVIGLALTGVIFAFLPKVNQFRSYQATKAELEEDIRAKEEAIKDLRLKQERFASDKYFVQQIAHETGYAHEGETIYQFNEKAVSNPPSASANKGVAQ
jgi:cell division protein FtsB